MNQNNKYKTVHFKIKNCPENVLSALADFYAFIFNNASDHFFVHKVTAVSLGKGDIPELATYGDGYISNAIIQDLHTEIYDEKGYALWHHKEITLKNIKRKLHPEGHLVLLVDSQAGDQIKGFTFGRRFTLNEALETEEWLNPYIYSEVVENSDLKRSRAFFLDNINKFLKSQDVNTFEYTHVELNTPIFCWNAAGLAPGLQGKGHMRAINDVFFRNMPKEWGKLLLLGEASDKKMDLESQRKRTNLENFQRVGADRIMKISGDLHLIGVAVEKFVQGFTEKMIRV